MKYTVYLLVIIVLFGCTNSSKVAIVKKDSVILKAASDNLQEDFDLFFNRFNTDSVFQVSRVNFPLKIIITEMEGDTIKYLPKIKWTYVKLVNAEKHKEMIEKTVIKKDTIDARLYAEDTGISVSHIFVCKNGKWYLNSVRNDSD